MKEYMGKFTSFGWLKTILLVVLVVKGFPVLRSTNVGNFVIIENASAAYGEFRTPLDNWTIERKIGVADGAEIMETSFGFTRNYIDTKYGGNGKPGWVHAADMDKDGDLDIVAGGGFALFIYENDGNAGGWRRYGNLDSTGNMGANGAVLYDVDHDGDMDVVAAKYNNDLGWWENPGGSLSNTTWAFHKLGETSMYLHDIIRVDMDQDGVAEEFVANMNKGYWNASITLKWFRPGTNPTQEWETHTIEPDRVEGASHGHAGMDVGDIDLDGDVDLAYSNGWYEAPDNPTGAWTWHEVTDVYGISNALIRDMDADGKPDLVMSAGHHGQGVYWFENPGEPYTNGWVRHDISKVVGDVTKRHIYITGTQPEHLHHPECLGVLDLDGDNDQDIVTCELFFGEDPGEPGWNEQAHHVYVYENVGNSSAPAWNKQNVAPNSFPSHLLQMVDINQDGQMDILSEGAGFSVVSYFENTTFPTTFVPPPAIQPNGGNFINLVRLNLTTSIPGAEIRYTLDGSNPTTYSTLYSSPFYLFDSATVKTRAFKDGIDDNEIAAATFKIEHVFDFDMGEVDASYPGNGRPGWSASGDIDGDGQVDIVSGGGRAIQWYQAPDWTVHPVEKNSSAGGNGGLVFDVDRDGDLDIVAALYLAELVWWENPGSGSAVTLPWNRHNIDATNPQGFNHDLDFGDIDGDGDGEVVALYVDKGGVVWYDIPQNPAQDTWSPTTILASIDDPYVGLAIGDMDSDGDLDVLASNKWYERPSNPASPNWTGRIVITDPVQNVFTYDVNGDGRLDVVAAEGFEHPNGRILWAEAPADPKMQAWTEHILADDLDGPENIWAGDLDTDGNTEIVTAEMGTSTGWNDNDSNFIVFEGLDAKGLGWKQHIVVKNVGVSARINPVDIDGDGDVDFTADGNAEDHIYLWENQTDLSGGSAFSLSSQIWLPYILRSSK